MRKRHATAALRVPVICGARPLIRFPPVSSSRSSSTSFGEVILASPSPADPNDAGTCTIWCKYVQDRRIPFYSNATPQLVFGPVATTVATRGNGAVPAESGANMAKGAQLQRRHPGAQAA